MLIFVGSTALAARYDRRARRAKRRAHREHAHSEAVTHQLHVAGQFVGHLANSVIPAAAAAAQAGRTHEANLAVPTQLVGTAMADALDELVNQVSAAIALTGQRAHAAAEERLAQARREADEQVVRARKEAVDVARAAVRAFASSTVQRASKLSTTISTGVRRHVSDDAYETLVEIDHLAQQMLLTASGYAVLAGDKLSRRHPATSLSEVVRAAMGRVEGYQRVQHSGLDTFAVESRAVEPVVHTLALLLDNGLRYSPPNARVHVSVEHGNDAIFLIVDDAGLRMEDERLNWARRVMSSAERDDITKLGAYPQTGLRVAAVLAADYGYRVEVTAPNVYGGTRAFIVLPRSLLTVHPPPVASATPPRPSAPSRELTPAEPAANGPTTASGLTVRRRATHPAPPARPASAAQPVEPGRPEVATAWMEGTRLGREQPTTPSETEGH
ncbi:ATP-binding protein [Streptomyces sp. JJ38]|uniref:ATP-binding protein n=1 Tax=Streptomyces sp. JJ38 TaxID=2738128 RepID=UPI0027E16E76|nr:ATP-binding protein [Streptomyces sp. JJ38]